jgi:hypothetical protein
VRILGSGETLHPQYQEGGVEVPHQDGGYKKMEVRPEAAMHNLPVLLLSWSRGEVERNEGEQSPLHKLNIAGLHIRNMHTWLSREHSLGATGGVTD